MINLSKLEEITDLRTVWEHEASDFTPWLAEEENISLLADALGLEITVEEKESDVGDFHVDILAVETGTNRKIIIENQLEDTNHDHLGKLITYAAGKSAEIIIWLVKHAREEHRAAIEWLNNNTNEAIGFFLCEIKLYRIGESAPAVKFEIVEKPNDWTKELRKTELVNDNQLQRRDYWVAFQEYAFQKKSFAKNFKRRKPTTDNWFDFGIGSSACIIRISQVRKHKNLIAEIYIHNNKELFRTLLDNKETIESESGLNFDWRELPDKKASRVLIIKQVSFDDKAAWHEQFDWLIDVMIKLKKTFAHYL